MANDWEVIYELEVSIRKAQELLKKLKGDKNCEENLESRVGNLLVKLGVPANLKGFKYLHTAIIMVLKNPDKINKITRGLYPEIAEKYNDKPNRVERAIRHSIEASFSRCSIELQEEVFGYSINEGKGRPSNSEFIGMVSASLRYGLK